MPQIAITVNLIVKADTVPRAVEITEARLTAFLNKWFVEDLELKRYLEGSLLLWSITPVGERNAEANNGTADQRIPSEKEIRPEEH